MTGLTFVKKQAIDCFNIPVMKDLEPCKAEAPCCAQAPAKPKAKVSSRLTNLAKEKKMRYYDEYNDRYVDAPESDTQRTQNYFFNRVSEVGSAKRYDLMKTYGLRNDDAPESFDEFMARINAGKFSFETYPKKKDTQYWADYIEWRDPSVKKDQKGYDAATKDFESAQAKARDTIMSSAPADAAAAIAALEAWTPTTTAS